MSASDAPRQRDRALTEFESLMLQLFIAVGKFPANRRDEILFGEWSIANIVAHLSAWNLVTIDGLKRLVDGKEITAWIADDQTNQFNADAIKKRRKFSWKKLVSELEDTYAQLFDCYEALSPREWGMQFGPIPNATAMNSLNTDIDHLRLHLQKILSAVAADNAFEALLTELMSVGEEIIKVVGKFAKKYSYTYEMGEIQNEVAYLTAWNRIWIHELVQVRKFGLRIIEWPNNSRIKLAEFKERITDQSKEQDWRDVAVSAKTTLDNLCEAFRSLLVAQRINPLGPSPSFTPMFTLNVMLLSYKAVLSYVRTQIKKAQKSD